MEAAKLSLEIPAEVIDAVKLPPKEMEQEFRKELALALYQRQGCSILRGVHLPRWPPRAGHFSHCPDGGHFGKWTPSKIPRIEQPWYQRGVLSLGKARLLAKMTRWEFEELLGQRKIPRHYTKRDLDEDIRYGPGHQ